MQKVSSQPIASLLITCSAAAIWLGLMFESGPRRDAFRTGFLKILATHSALILLGLLGLGVGLLLNEILRCWSWRPRWTQARS